MSLIDKAKAVANGSAELTAATEEQDQLNVKDAKLSARGQQLVQELASLKSSLGELALDETPAGRKAYDAALAGAERMERDQRHNADAQAAVRLKLQELAQRIHQLGLAKAIKTFERIAAERLKRAEHLQQKIAEYTEAYQLYQDASQKLLIAFPSVQFDCEPQHTSRAVALELYRALPVDLLDKHAGDRLAPGAHSGIGLDAPANLVSLADEVKRANAAMLHTLKEKPIEPQPTLAEIFEAKQPAARPTARNSTGTVSADEIMAGMKTVSIQVPNGRAK
jgi:hypothetical protein